MGEHVPRVFLFPLFFSQKEEILVFSPRYGSGDPFLAPLPRLSEKKDLMSISLSLFFFYFEEFRPFFAKKER